jgi:cell division protein FtsB
MLLRSLLESTLACCRPATLAKWVAFAVVPVALWLALNASTLREYFAQRDLRDFHRAKVAHLEQSQLKLDHEQRQLRTGGFSTEKSIRERLLYARPGEKVIFIEPSEPDSDGPALAVEPSIKMGTAMLWPPPPSDRQRLAGLVDQPAVEHFSQ